MELRRTPRAPIDVAVDYTVKGDATVQHGRAHDISLGGMFVATAVAPAFNAEVVVTLTLPGQKAPFTLPGIVRWRREDGMGVQFGLIGARETYAITEVVRRSEAGERISDPGDIDVKLDD